MAKYSKTLLDLLKEEDELVTELEEPKDDIIKNLYITRR